jgi:hypothetical protein
MNFLSFCAKFFGAGIAQYNDKVMDCTTEESGFDFRQELEIFLFPASRPALGPTQPPIHGTEGPFPGASGRSVRLNTSI